MQSKAPFIVVTISRERTARFKRAPLTQARSRQDSPGRAVSGCVAASEGVGGVGCQRSQSAITRTKTTCNTLPSYRNGSAITQNTSSHSLTARQQTPHSVPPIAVHPHRFTADSTLSADACAFGSPTTSPHDDSALPPFVITAKALAVRPPNTTHHASHYPQTQTRPSQHPLQPHTTPRPLAPQEGKQEGAYYSRGRRGRRPACHPSDVGLR